MATNLDQETKQRMEAEARAANRLAEALAAGRDFVISTAITYDFFQGYSLTEAIQDRLDHIGTLNKEKDSLNVKNSTTNKKRVSTTKRAGLTLQAELDKLEDEFLLAIHTLKELNIAKSSVDEVET